MEGESERDDLVRERLQEAAGADPAVRQLRRRYDALRRDYEELLDRLGELEERISEGDDQRSRGPDPLSAVNEALAAPLLELRDSYVATSGRLQAIISGLERVASGAMKGQRRAGDEPRAERREPPPPASDEPAPATRTLGRVNLDVRGRGFGDLLDFQERLSSVPGVTRVSINAIEPDRATLIVELDQAPRNP